MEFKLNESQTNPHAHQSAEADMTKPIYFTIRDERTVGVPNSIRLADSPDDYTDEPGDSYERVVTLPEVTDARRTPQGIEVTTISGARGVLIVSRDGSTVWAIPDRGPRFKVALNDAR